MKKFIEIETTRTQKEPFSSDIAGEGILMIDPERVESMEGRSILMYSGLVYTLTNKSIDKLMEYYSYQNINVKETHLSTDDER